MNPLSLDNQHPGRPVNWRWRLAIEMVEQGEGPFRRSPDPAVAAAKRFWGTWTRCRGASDRRGLAGRMPTLYDAYSIYHDTRGPARHALEARLLAGETPAVIAERSSTSPEVVPCYGDIFFDIGDRLSRPDFILHQVIGPRLYEGVEGWSYELVWKLFAYLGGTQVLDEFMHGAGTLSRPKNPLEVAAVLSHAARAAVRRQMVAAAYAVAPGDPRLARELLATQAHLVGKHDSAEDGGVDNTFTQQIDALMKELPWAVGSDAPETIPSQVAEVDQLAMELRSNELMRLSAGDSVPNLVGLRHFSHWVRFGVHQIKTYVKTACPF